jgi:hypothetical protein
MRVPRLQNNASSIPQFNENACELPYTLKFKGLIQVKFIFGVERKLCKVHEVQFHLAIHP